MILRLASMVALAVLIGDAGAALTGVIYDAVNSNSYSTSVLMIGPEDMPVQFEATMMIETATVDAHALAPDQYGEGVKLKFVLDHSTVRRYGQINAPLEPAAVPEEFAR